MAKEFLGEEFLLSTETSRVLFHDYARQMPIFDYHCHLPVAEIAENRRFENMSRIWLAGDHYKWRAMRACGVEERLITGDASDWEKFLAWAETVPYTIRNPLYHWTHMELRNPFGVRELLSPQTARGVWERCNELLAGEQFRARGLMSRFNVKVVCTTDDPTDTLEHHRQIRQEGFAVKVLPAFRADKALAVDNPPVFTAWLGRLEEAVGRRIGTFPELIEALRERHAYFHEMGSRLSDHGIEVPYAAAYTDREVGVIFAMAREGQLPAPQDVLKLKSAMLYELCVMDAERDWTQQFHFGALRGVSSRMQRLLGPDTGYDAMGDFEIARPLVRLLDRLETAGKLARTIVYVLNPRDNEMVASIAGSFQDGSARGKMQLGSAWWFNDQKSGMEWQMNALSNVGLLSTFVGMLTDSRSFLSYPRHEYFRRVLCDLIGREVEAGELPADIPHLGGIVQDVCFNNAARYFRIPVE